MAQRPAMVRSKETLSGHGGDGFGVRRSVSSPDEKPELTRGDSDVSDHTKDLQRNLMRQVHGDVIDRPDMLMRDETGSPDAIGSLLNRGISELTKVTRFRYTVFAVASLHSSPNTIIVRNYEIFTAEGGFRLG